MFGLLRAVAVLLLLAAALSYVLYAVTGKPQWKRRGLRLMLAFMAGAALFFGVLIMQRLD